MKFDYKNLHYLKARGPDDKRPAEEWGGYSQDLSEADCVYTHEEVEMLPHNHWLINGIHNQDHMTRNLLVFDIDLYKAPDGFDPDRVEIPTNTAVVRSQSGGFHVYFVINRSLRGKESDFILNDKLPFDIDIRGEFVKQHVVAPTDVPGVNTSYELVNDETISHEFDPSEAAKSITIDGEPAIRYRPSGGAGTAFGYERDEIDPPDDLPKCYAAGLELRKQAPDDKDLNTHKVNVLTALSGLASGYDIDTVVKHFVEDYYPGEPDQADEERTQYQVEHIAEKLDSGRYSPPAVSTLKQYSILPIDEWCDCGLPGHNGKNDDISRYYELDLLTVGADAGITVDPHNNRKALLKVCLHARENLDAMNGEKPPYDALVAVAEQSDLHFDDSEEKILGKTTYKIARRIFNDMDPSEVTVSD